MKRFLLLILTFSITHALFAQQFAGVVRGVVQDAATATALPGATVSVLNAADSTLLSYTLTNDSGAFEIKNLDTAANLLAISYQGFHTLYTPVRTTKQAPIINLGLVPLHHVFKTLDEVVVKEKAPVRVAGDTLAFNAAAFKTKPDAMAEDLLKKLPGLQVGRDGTVKAQGETVQKIYVDGKEFFGDDPKLATRNITADMIDEVQLYDDRSEQSKFNKIEDGSRTKAINLKLKPDKKRGLFGQADAGYGTARRYSANARLNQLNGERRISLFANSNNTNRTGFSTSDLSGSMLPMNQSGNTGGITDATAAGINYNNAWNKAVELSGNYNGNQAHTTNALKSFRQNFFPTGNIDVSRSAETENENNVNRAGFRVSYTMNERNAITYAPALNLQNSQLTSTDSSTSFALEEGLQQRINQTRSTIRNKGQNTTWNHNLIWRKAFARLGRTLTATFSNTHTNNQLNGYNTALSTDYDSRTGAPMQDSTRNQQNKQHSNTDNIGVALSYTEPVGRDKTWEVNYNYARNKNTANRQTYDLNAFSGKYDLPNEGLTNFFENTAATSRIGTNLRIGQKKYNYQVGIAYASSVLESHDLSKGTVLRQRFNNLFPNASFNYQFASSRSLRINYRGATAQPSVLQLQPIADVTNPRYICQGNPTLGQEFRNNLSLTYNVFNVTTLRNFFASATFSNTYHKIGYSSQVIDSFGKQLVRPVNLNGTYNVSANINLGFPIKRMQGGNVNLITMVSYNHDPNLLNNIRSFSKNLALGEDLRLNYTYKEKLDLGLNAAISYTLARYTVQPQRRSVYLMHRYGAEATYFFSNGFILSSNFDFTANTGRSRGFNQRYALWNAAVAKSLLQNQRGELRVSVFDILANNRSLVRITGDTFMEDVETGVLNRFLMLSFSYKFNRMGGKASKTVK